LAHPEGNITGLAIAAGEEIWGKRLSLLTQLLPPGSSTIGYLVGEPGWNGPQGASVFSSAHKLGLSIVGRPMVSPYSGDTLRAAISSMAKAGAAGMIVTDFGFSPAQRADLVALAQQWRLPAVYPYPDLAELGGLAAYGIQFDEVYRIAGTQVVLILQGHPVADIPFVQISKQQFVINLKAAKQLGLKIAPSLLAQADQVIE
jgi:putative tryptophan/tyrosine transport system substrate-binding protein